MNRNPRNNRKRVTQRSSDRELLMEFGELWEEADALWQERHEDAPFHAYVSADYMEVFESLARLREKAATFLEWGSGLGVVTIMASRMGYDAFGIEAEGELVEHSEDFAEKYGPDARFAQGSFIPDGFVWNPADGDESVKTMIDVADAYSELDMELRDFDLIYSYPWPTEHTMYHNILRQFGADGVLLLTYDAREGIDVIKLNSRR